MTRALASEPDALQVNNLLFEAARKGCVGALPTLFDAHASPLARDRGGNTALALAARAGRVEFLKALLAGAAKDVRGQLDARNVVGSTPLTQAAFANRLEAAKLLIAAGADVQAANRQGETALSDAAFTGNFELAELLLSRGAKPDAIDATGKSPIVYAAARGAADIVEKLLDAGIDVNARYANHLTALMWAAGHADNVATEAGVRAVKLLLARGARIDDVDDRGRSALMIAAGLGHAAIVGVLLEAGADKTARDKFGQTAWDLAGTDEVKARLGGS
jgi:ankyrin repeat protein